jgi:superfamily II DNA/RNA helicase
LVVNFDVPENPEDYVHRIGRTGRAGETGRAVTIATPQQSSEVYDIERLIGREIPVAEDSPLRLAPRPERSGGGGRGRRPQRGPRPTQPREQTKPQQDGRPARSDSPRSGSQAGPSNSAPAQAPRWDDRAPRPEKPRAAGNPHTGFPKGGQPQHPGTPRRSGPGGPAKGGSHPFEKYVKSPKRRA